MNCRTSYIFLNYKDKYCVHYNYDLFRFFMNLLESSLIINQLLPGVLIDKNLNMFINIKSQISQLSIA